MTKSRRFGRRHRAARHLAHRRARVERVESRIDEAVESHRGAARADHADDDPRDLRQANGCVRQASSAPVSANGSANTEWLKRTNER